MALEHPLQSRRPLEDSAKQEIPDDNLLSGSINFLRGRKRQRMLRQIQPSPPLRSILNPFSLLLLVFTSYTLPVCRSFTSPRNTKHGSLPYRGIKAIPPISSSKSTASTIAQDAIPLAASTLPDLYPNFANILSTKGYIIPTPIQQSSALPAQKGENLVLIAATGSGKTLAYFLPVLSRACNSNNRERAQKNTVLVIAPTRELAAQLARDASVLLPDEILKHDDAPMFPNVLLAVRGIPPPTPTQMSHATVLIGTPDELYAVLTRISGAQNFIAGGTLYWELYWMKLMCFCLPLLKRFAPLLTARVIVINRREKRWNSVENYERLNDVELNSKEDRVSRGRLSIQWIYPTLGIV